jgi:hypothetical protein
MDSFNGRERLGEVVIRWRDAAERARDLDWLGLFLASWVAPLALDTAIGLTYFTSLLFWLVPTLLLLPRFLHYTDPGGRRRRALRITILQIAALGIVLDFVLGRYVLQFDTVNPQRYVLWLRDVPLEEVLFYAMAPIAILLVYAWCDEYWVAEYNPVKQRLAAAAAKKPLVLSIRALALASALEALGLYLKRRWDPAGPIVPVYYTFLVVGAFVPAWLFFNSIGPLVNWRAFGVTTLYVLFTSLVWEATLALPREWWGYQRRAMIGYFVGAWSSKTVSFPLEAAIVWVCAPFSCILTYEAVKHWQYRRRPTKAVFAPRV